MSTRSRENSRAVIIVVIAVISGVVVGVVSVVSGVGVVSGVVSGVVVGVVVGRLRRRRRGSQVPASRQAISPLEPRTLRLVRGLLPSNEGAAWLAEVTSCLAEAHDKGERRRYVRSYRRGVPRLIWTSWAEHLSASHRRKLS